MYASHLTCITRHMHHAPHASHLTAEIRQGWAEELAGVLSRSEEVRSLAHAMP